ncbi:MAG: hypothetical protein JWO02_2110 [Solirubrobacterales bacterium]|nr:hypothetical protein [Solirubrobacterales bacterium]
MEQRKEWAAVTRAALHQRRERRLRALLSPESPNAPDRRDGVTPRRAGRDAQARAQHFAYLRTMHD